MAQDDGVMQLVDRFHSSDFAVHREAASELKRLFAPPALLEQDPVVLEQLQRAAAAPSPELRRLVADVAGEAAASAPQRFAATASLMTIVALLLNDNDVGVAATAAQALVAACGGADSNLAKAIDDLPTDALLRFVDAGLAAEPCPLHAGAAARRLGVMAEHAVTDSDALTLLNVLLALFATAKLAGLSVVPESVLRWATALVQSGSDELLLPHVLKCAAVACEHHESNASTLAPLINGACVLDVKPNHWASWTAAVGAFATTTAGVEAMWGAKDCVFARFQTSLRQGQPATKCCALMAAQASVKGVEHGVPPRFALAFVEEQFFGAVWPLRQSVDRELRLAVWRFVTAACRAAKCCLEFSGAMKPCVARVASSLAARDADAEVDDERIAAATSLLGAGDPLLVGVDATLLDGVRHAVML